MAPSITKIPNPVPTSVGQFVPDCGKAASVGAGAPVPETRVVDVGLAVMPQVQSVLVGHDLSRQKP